MALTYSDFLIRGLSTDSKPTVHPYTGAALPKGWRFFETNTDKWFVYDSAAWVEMYGTAMPAMDHDVGGQYMEFDQITAPTNPVAGTRRLFVDSADGKLKVRTSAGASTSLEEAGGGGTSKESHITLLSLFTEAVF